MHTIVVLFQPFVLKQNIVIYNQDKQLVGQHEVAIDDIPAYIERITQDIPVELIRVSGHRDYINKYQVDIIQKVPNIKFEIG